MAKKAISGKQAEKKLLSILKEWKKVETATINSCKKILSKTENPIVVTLINTIKLDSEKHKSIIQLIISSYTKKAIALTPEEIASVSKLLDKHMSYEEKSINLAEDAIAETREIVVKQLLKNILSDEKKHIKITEQLNQLKIRALTKIS